MENYMHCIFKYVCSQGCGFEFEPKIEKNEKKNWTQIRIEIFKKIRIQEIKKIGIRI